MPVVLLLRSCEELSRKHFLGAESGLSWACHGRCLPMPLISCYLLMSKRTQQEQGLLLQGGVFAFIAFAILEKLDETE